MRILHTSDWHLGKTLEGFSRAEEQEKFIDEIVSIVEKNSVDLLLIAGDIYDNVNPPAASEALFYKALKEITKDNKCAVLVIAGNHDSPDRILAPMPLALDKGIVLLGTLKDCMPKGKYGNLNIIDSGEGYIEVEINKERVVIIALPYPSEKRLNEVFEKDMDEVQQQKSYSERIGQLLSLLSLKYREDTINILVSHLYIKEGKESDSERSIQLGGSFAVDESSLPCKAQYIALGHLHRPQSIESVDKKIYYSGSPLQYSKSEVCYSKCVYIVDVSAGEEAKVSEVFLKNYKPIEIWRCKGIEEAIEKCSLEKDKNAWIYIEIETDRVLSLSEMKQMRDYQSNIIEIKPILNSYNEEAALDVDYLSKSMKELFIDFYKSRRQAIEPTDELVELFLKITEEEGDSDEA